MMEVDLNITEIERGVCASRNDGRVIMPPDFHDVVMLEIFGRVALICDDAVLYMPSQDFLESFPQC